MKIPVANPTFSTKEANLVKKIIIDGWVSQGEYNLKFENKIKKFCNSKHALVTNNGTSAIHAILLALNIGPGDEVIVPSLTYISSVNAVMYVGAKPILCDVDPYTCNVSAKYIAPKINKKTKAIISVDLKGMPVDFDELIELSSKKNVYLISDSAESFGAKYKKQNVGNQCLFHTFSFFANKNITTGEGGAITVQDTKYYKIIKKIINQGQESRYKHVLLGNNFRLTNIQSAIGYIQINRLKKILIEKNKYAKIYKKLITSKKISFQKIPEYVSQHSYYNFTIFMKPAIKNKLKKYLLSKKIETRESFPPVHIQPYYKKKFNFKKNDFKNSFDSYNSFLDIPIWYGMGNNRVQYISKLINDFLS